jgi:hypothetical protein
MNKPSVKEQQQREREILVECREMRRQCGKLSADERRQLLEEGLAIINGRDAKSHARSH